MPLTLPQHTVRSRCTTLTSAPSRPTRARKCCYWGQDPTDKFPTAPHIELTLDSTVSAGPAGTDEDILFGAFATVNSAATGTYEFIAKKLGYINNSHAREYLLDVNDPVAAAASTDVQSSTVINFTKDASNTSIVLSHDGSHYGVNTISAVLESDGTISIKGVGENGEDTVTNINYQNVQIAGVSPANTPAGVVNALNALFTVNPLGAGYVPVTVLPVSEGANVGLNLREGIVPTEGIYADPFRLRATVRVWTTETVNQHGEFFEFMVRAMATSLSAWATMPTTAPTWLPTACRAQRQFLVGAATYSYFGCHRSFKSTP